jgi:hypothetical protein
MGSMRDKAICHIFEQFGLMLKRTPQITQLSDVY